MRTVQLTGFGGGGASTAIVRRAAVQRRSTAAHCVAAASTPRPAAPAGGRAGKLAKASWDGGVIAWFLVEDMRRGD